MFQVLLFTPFFAARGGIFLPLYFKLRISIIVKETIMNKEFNIEVKIALMKKGWKQKDLADAIDVSIPSLRQYLNGYANYPYGIMEKIRQVLNLKAV